MFTAASVSPLPHPRQTRGSRRVLRNPFVGDTCAFDGQPELQRTHGPHVFLSQSSSLPTFQSDTATSSMRSTTRPAIMHSWHRETLHNHEHCVPRCHRGNLNEVHDPSGNDADLPAGLPTKKGTQRERNTARQRASTLRYLCSRGPRISFDPGCSFLKYLGKRRGRLCALRGLYQGFLDVQPKPGLPGLHSYDQDGVVVGTAQLLVDVDQDSCCPKRHREANNTDQRVEKTPQVGTGRHTYQLPDMHNNTTSPRVTHSGTEENDSCHWSGGT